jgi:hypothetical protein
MCREESLGYPSAHGFSTGRSKTSWPPPRAARFQLSHPPESSRVQNLSEPAGPRFPAQSPSRNSRISLTTKASSVMKL